MTLGTLLATFLLDQLSKFLALRALSFGESVPVLPPLFYVTLVQNTGIAFGMFQKWSRILLWMNLGILSFLFVLIGLRRFERRMVQVGIGMVAGGGLGNLVDRFRFGYIVDFLDVRVRWPVFNLADSAICIGTGLILWALFRKR